MLRKYIPFILSIFLVLISGSCAPRIETSNKQIDSMAETRIVFMGNSITENWTDYRPEFFEGKPWINKGISGQVSGEMLSRFQVDVIELQPELVIILAGTNDIAGNQGPAEQAEIAGNIRSMAEMADEAGIKIILCSVPPAAEFPWNAGQAPAIRIPALNLWIKEYSKKNGIVYADYFGAMATADNGMKEELAYDGVHPNKEGYAIMEKVISAAIIETLKTKN